MRKTLVGITVRRVGGMILIVEERGGGGLGSRGCERKLCRLCVINYLISNGYLKMNICPKKFWTNVQISLILSCMEEYA